MRMKIKFILFTLAICFNFEAYCQDIYSKQSQTNNWFYDIFQEKGTSNLLLSNLNFTFNPITNSIRNKAEILKLSSTGSLISSIQIDSNFSYNQILRINSNYFILGQKIINYSPGNSAHLIEVIKYDLNFNKVKKLVLDSFYNKDPQVVKLISKRSRLYLGYMRNQNPDTFNLFKLDQNLNKLDSLTFSKGSLFDIENLGDNLILCGNDFFQNGQNSTNKIAKIDTSFNLNWQFYLDSLTSYITSCGLVYPEIGLNYTHVIEIDSNKYLVRGNTFALNTNCSTKVRIMSVVVNGNKQIRQTHLIGIDTLNNVCTGGFGSSSKRYNFIYSTAMSGYDDNNPFPPQSNNTSILVTKLDTSGSLIWVKYFGGDKYYLPQSIHATSDSGVVICGMRYDHEIPQVENVCEGFVMKLDKNGGTNFVGIQEKGTLNFSYHKCFPNPTNQEIKFDVPLVESMRIEIFDESGKKIKQIDNYQNLSALKLTEFTNGIYYYKIYTTTKTYSGKFVKE